MNMAAYNNAAGGCCGPDSHVLMADESYKQASEIKKGDEVMTYSTRRDPQGRYMKCFQRVKLNVLSKHIAIKDAQ